MTTPLPAIEPPAFVRLLELVRGRRLVALAGAGCSTESGIPDYRGPQGSLRTRKPMQYQEFVRSAAARAHYWVRSAVGWPRLAAARPNPAHRALARLERAGILAGVITQNVDGLHQAAGSRQVLELHGSLASVRCLGCGQVLAREAFQDRLDGLNPAWAERRARNGRPGLAETAPDGDAELDEGAPPGFRVPACERCGGILKPDVVFFGENVPRPRVERAWRLLAEGDVLLVVGSSLTVYSGRRFVDGARRAGMPVAIVNLGPTRGDDVAATRLEARLGLVLPRLAEALLGPARD